MGTQPDTYSKRQVFHFFSGLGYTTAHANTNRMVFLSHRHRIQSRHRTDIRTISPNSVQQEIEAEKNKAELALYKAQINPHFLFNTLNALYGLVLTKSDKTESAFIQFSNILKYMYAQTTSETIPVCNEIDYIRQYVDLQALRLNKHTHISFEKRTTPFRNRKYGHERKKGKDPCYRHRKLPQAIRIALSGSL